MRGTKGQTRHCCNGETKRESDVSERERYVIYNSKWRLYLHLAQVDYEGEQVTFPEWGPVDAAEQFNQRTAAAIMARVGDGDGQTVMLRAARR